MANRFPLVVDATDSNIKEMPDGDFLDMTGSGIANLNNLSLVSQLTAATITLSSTITAAGADISAIAGGTLTLTGGVTAAGVVDASNYTVSGNPLSSIQVQPNWNETDPNDPSFINNKPVISGIDRLTDIPDVFANYPSDGSVVDKILKWDGFSWQGVDNTGGGGGIELTDLSLISNPASGNGSLTYDDSTGEFSFTPALVPTSTSQLANDSNFITLTEVNAQGYITRASLSAGDPISYNSSTGVFTFDNTNTQFVTLAQVLLNVDLDAVLTAGALTTQSATFGTITANGAGTSALTNAEVTNLTVVTSLGSTNGNFATTNGNIVATNGDITAGNEITGNEMTSTVRLNTPEVKNSGNISIDAGQNNRVTVNNYLRIQPNASRPSSPQTGDFHQTNDYAEYYVANADGQGNAGWLQLPATNGTRGLQVPYFTTTQRNAISNPRPGEIILNITDNELQFRTQTGWVALGS
jgi:hypothetical protein